MCQLLGMNCNTPTDIAFSFTGFAKRGGKTDHHRDGWGIAFFEGRGLRHYVDHLPAADSPVAELIRHYPIKSEMLSLTSARPPKASSACRIAIPSSANFGDAIGFLPTMATSRTSVLACTRTSVPWARRIASMLSVG